MSSITSGGGGGAPNPHGASSHTGNIFPSANQNLGAEYMDIAQIAAPANPSSGIRRLYVDSVTGKVSVRTSAGASVSLEEGGVFARGGTFYNSTGILSAVNVIVWRAPFACTVTALKGWRVGGTDATVNAGKGTTATPTSPILATDLDVTATETWMDGGAVQNTAFAAGDPLILEVTSVTGSPTEIAIQVEFTRP